MLSAAPHRREKHSNGIQDANRLCTESQAPDHDTSAKQDQADNERGPPSGSQRRMLENVSLIDWHTDRLLHRLR
jgi:hypothetical protein